MNILLVSDDVNFSDTLRKKLVFLRHEDNIFISDYENALKNLDNTNIVLIHQNADFQKTLDIIKSLQENELLSLIFIANSNDAVTILSVFDLGVDDYILADAPDFEYVIRIINNGKFNTLKSVQNRNLNLLKQANVTDELLGFYQCEYYPMIVENSISFQNREPAIFMAIAPNDKITLSFEALADAIKSSIRTNDIVFVGKGVNFYLFLQNTDFNGAVSVFNKIKLIVDVKAGISDIANKKIDELEKDALNALAEALNSERDYIFAHEKENTLDEWLSDEKTGNYKLFRKVFNKKLEKVIAPVFYRLQKSYEEKLWATKIEQYTNSEQCVFTLKNDSGESSLRIVYPGFAKIIIYITHEGLDSPENREIPLLLSKVSQRELVNIVENFINEFKETRC